MKKFFRNKKGFIVLLISSLVLLLISLVACVSLGIIKISFSKTFLILFSKIFGCEVDATISEYNVILLVRLPRILACIAVGIALTVSSCIYQSIFNNPLVDSGLLGVSSGSSVGAVIGILLGLSTILTMSISFFAGIITVLITVSIPLLFKNQSNYTLILSGIIIGGFMGSLLSFLKLVADPETQLADITYWLMGSFSKTTNEQLYVAIPIIVTCFVLTLIFSWRLNILSIGEVDAKHLGVNVKAERLLFIVLSTIMTATSVCICGNISWVGIIIPHFVKFLVGGDNCKVIPLSAVFGSIFLIWCDYFSRTLSQIEIPIGIVIGLIGAPVFAIILTSRRSRNVANY